VAVHEGGVDQLDTELDRPAQDAQRARPDRRIGGVQAHRAKAEAAHRQVAADGKRWLHDAEARTSSVLEVKLY